MRGQFAMVKKISKPEPIKKNKRNFENQVKQGLGNARPGMLRDDANVDRHSQFKLSLNAHLVGIEEKHSNAELAVQG